MREFITMIANTIKYRFAAITTKIRYWTNINYLRTQFFSRFGTWFTGLFNVKPKHKSDYYTIFIFMVSRKLVHLVVICLGLICIVYLWMNNPFEQVKEPSTIKTYVYKSVPLKFKTGTVNIKAESGYIAYTGDVKGGHAVGKGTLYNPDGGIVYDGEFAKSMYNGVGTAYFPNGQKQYYGDFVDNKYEGNGKLYRKNGVLHYSGEFHEGYMDGMGELCNATGVRVFNGEFSRDEIVYTQFLDRTSDEMNELYMGDRTAYSFNGNNIVAMDEISALYVPNAVENSVSDELRTKSVYVVRDVFVIGGKRIESVSELKAALGEPQYEGNAYLTFEDAAAIKWCQESGRDINIDTGLDYEQSYDELITVNSYNQDAMLYLYVYEIGNVSYTFIAAGHENAFFMYTIEM